MQESLVHCLTFLLLHPPVLYFIYTLIAMQQFCHQKFNLPHKNGVPTFHHPTHKSSHIVFHCPHPVYRRDTFSTSTLTDCTLHRLKIWGGGHESVKHLTLINVTVFLWLCSSISNTLLPTPMFLNLMKFLILWTGFPKLSQICQTT